MNEEQKKNYYDRCKACVFHKNTKGDQPETMSCIMFPLADWERLIAQWCGYWKRKEAKK